MQKRKALLISREVPLCGGDQSARSCTLTLSCSFPQQPTLSDMTMYEMNFSLLVEDMLGNIDQPQYRQIVVEVRTAAQAPEDSCRGNRPGGQFPDLEPRLWGPEDGGTAHSTPVRACEGVGHLEPYRADSGWPSLSVHTHPCAASVSTPPRKTASRRLCLFSVQLSL